ncbi:MAG: cytochrome c5 [Gammaproteobacteria bacterium]|jgi:cytochrome c5|tara:strand:- start:242 stop:739 length:498 start_codon:yes stop_codon:yes gene_type:complete
MEHKVTDAEFYKVFAIVSVIIIGLAIFIAILSNVFAGYASSASENYKVQIQSDTNQRIAPSGKINLASNPSIKQEVMVASVSETKILTAKEVYNTVCMSCHTSGAAGAPVIGNNSQWSDRLAKGKDALYASAINGIGIMPAKGGVSSLSDNEIKSAVDYILSESN